MGLYVTAKEAYEMWKTAPERVNILDVRTPEEYVFVGHAEMARNIPLVFVKHQWDADSNQFVMEPNPDFISRVKGLFAPTDTLLVMCRTGGRSAKAVNALPNQGLRTFTTSSTAWKETKLNAPADSYREKGHKRQM